MIPVARTGSGRKAGWLKPLVFRYRQIGIPDKQAIDRVLNKLIEEAERSAKESRFP